MELVVATPPGHFDFSPPPIDVLVGSETVVTRTVGIVASTGAPVAFTLAETLPWLSLSASQGQAPASFDVLLDSNGLANGVYTGEVIASGAGFDDSVLSVRLTMDVPPAELQFAPLLLDFAVEPGFMDTAQVQLTTTTGDPVMYELAENVPWLELGAPMGTTPQTIDVSVDATGLVSAVYQAVVTVTAPGFAPVSLPVQLTVGDPNACAPIACEDIMVDLPFSLDFTQDHGGILDAANVGTGFTTIEAPDGSLSYRPELIVANHAEGVLELMTTAGLHHRTANSQINTLGVGIDAPNQVAIVKTTLVEPNGGTGRFEQGGLWFGIDDDNFLKFVVASTRAGTQLHALLEVDGIPRAQATDVPRDFTGVDVEMELVIDPENERVIAYATLPGSPRREIARFQPPPAFFSFDVAGIHPAIGTRSFVGIFGSHRYGPAPLVYRFRGFSIDVGASPNSGGGVAFDRTELPAEDPTNLVWGPDDRLYATSLLGRVTAYTLDPLNEVIATEAINTLTSFYGNRLTLGIAVGPESTSSDVVLCVSHSNASLNAGQIDSAIVSRLSGPGFTNVQSVITGLPRAVANHSINSIHFGPDGRLYIAVRSNTGAGATNQAITEFGDRAEQHLSAAILVADVFAPNFDGTCQNASDPFGVPPCSVTPWVTGVRNMYDFVFHSNGLAYGPDNGLGAVGTFPASAVAPCFGYANPALVSQGGQNPGTQPDPLHLLEAGGFYGHPNPARGECVFGDGSLQGVTAPANYRAPLFNLGAHRSANGITEYPFDVGCVPLGGDLLIANYSVGDNLTRIVLSPDGRSVLADEVFATGFVNPIAVTTNPDGTIFVAELGADRIAALVPRSLGCWARLPDRPEPVIYPAAAEVGGELLTVGGRSSSGGTNAAWSFDPSAETWTSRAAIPGPALEGSGAASVGGQFYVLGGATSALSGAVDACWSYDPATDSWSSIAPMSIERAFAACAVVNGKIFVVGGLDSTGASLSSGEVFDPQTGAWSQIAPMTGPRDSTAAFAVGDELFVVGGRLRSAGGVTLDGGLRTLECFDTSTGSWTHRAPMPTGRRPVAVSILNGGVQVIGGQADAPAATVFTEVEEYDPGTDTWRALASLPEPRFGAAAATFGMRVVLVGGAGMSGAANPTAEALSFEF